ncbi:hypothetical protein Tsubulata_038640 [Turnera subulata]|uniref:Methyltransferase type 11 domain-containing protein n=1 Tax=Turnera subulata TaxID=218843 RepID=A0A9Q0F8C8_9ROSI|nr:hypothetical protein Tsubulata_038640 [Turnera subulata]
MEVVVETTATKEEVVQKKGIVEMYDEAANMWDELWGEHQHEGFYDTDSPVSGLKSDHKLAQTRMIQEALLFAGFSSDAIEQPFADGQFDLVWAMSCSEHVHDKRKFVSELVRVASPGGTIIIVSFFHRNLDSSEESLQPSEKERLEKIGELSFSKWCSAAELIKLLQAHYVEDIKTADRTPHVAPFATALVQSSSRPRVGPKTTKGANMTPLMVEGYEMGLIKYAIITCRKPQ